VEGRASGGSGGRTFKVVAHRSRFTADGRQLAASSPPCENRIDAAIAGIVPAAALNRRYGECHIIAKNYK
jgi:hypothetical protein